MKVEVEDISGVEKRLEIEIPAERVDDEIEDQYKELKNKARVRGFRPGKAPRKILERLFRDYVHEAVIKKLVEETLETALSRKKIEPVVEPVIDPSELVPGQDYNYTVHIEVKPEVEVSDYKGIQITHSDETVTDERLEQAIQALRERAALIKEPEAERPVKKDDQVTAMVSIKEGDEELMDEEGREEAIELWRGSWIPGLVERLEGRSKGDTVTFTAEIPEDGSAPPEFEGRTLEFSFLVKGIKERELPELNDEFARQSTKYETLEELRKSVRERLEEDVARDNRGRLEYALIEELINRNPIKAPPGLVKQEAVFRARQFIERTTRGEPSNEEAEQFVDIFAEEAKKYIRTDCLLEAVADKEGIEADDEAVEEWIKKEAEKLQLHLDKYKDRIGEKGMKAARHKVRMDNTLDFLARHANIKEGAKDEN